MQNHSKVIIDGYIHNPGRHCASTAISDVMIYNGYNLSEAMCFGLGAGLGFSYIKGDFLNPTHMFHTRSPNLETDFFRHIGVPFKWRTEDDDQKALDVVKACIDRGVPVLLQTDIYYLDYYDTKTHFPKHVVVLWGYDDEMGKAYVSDTEREGLQEVGYESLKRSRTSKESILPLNNNWHDIDIKGPIRDLKEAVVEALRKNASNMIEESDNQLFHYGIRAMRTVAEDLPDWASARDQKWCARFGYQIIEKRGTGGSGFRLLYRDFLKEAEGLIPDLSHLGLSAKMSEIAHKWKKLAETLKKLSESENTSLFSTASEMIKNIADMEESFYKTVLNNVF